jgi:hypothetical protein
MDDLEKRTLAVVRRFICIPYLQVVQLVLKEPGHYTFRAEQKLRLVLRDLMRRGALLAPSEWGPYRVPVTPAAVAAAPAEKAISSARPKLRPVSRSR